MSASGSKGNADPSAQRRAFAERPSLEQLRKQAKDLLRDALSGNTSALARLGPVTRTDGATPILLAYAQLALAREYGFPSWPKLVRHVESVTGAFVLRPLIRPVELSPGRRWTLAGGGDAAADEVVAMFVAARDGDAATVRRLVSRVPAFATVEYNYTPPIHFAAREGHRGIVEFLLDHDADPHVAGAPWSVPLVWAENKGHDQLAAMLRAAGAGREDR